MKLSELAPRFVRIVTDANGLKILWKRDAKEAYARQDAQGLYFQCPVCKDVHGVLLWFADHGVPDDAEPEGRWTVNSASEGFADLTLSPSVQLKTGCAWHGYIHRGEVTMI